MGAELELEKIVAELEEEIVLWVIAPGTRLVEDQLMERFGTKRHIVRSAFERLSKIGLVERIPNRGSVVRAFDQSEITMLYEYRIILEPAAASVIPMPVQSHVLDDLRRIQDSHDNAAQNRDLAALFRSNLAFHRCLFALCPNRFLSQAIEHAAMQAHAVRFLTMKDDAALSQAQADHHGMIQALSEGDRDALIGFCRDHLQRSHDTNIRVTRDSVTGEDLITDPREETTHEDDERTGAVSGTIRRR